MHTIQYTIRNIPPAVDRVIRKRVQLQGGSFNQTVVDLLSLQVLGTAHPKEEPGFDWLFNQSTLDSGFDDAIADLSRVDDALWI